LRLGNWKKILAVFCMLCMLLTAVGVPSLAGGAEEVPEYGVPSYDTNQLYELFEDFERVIGAVTGYTLPLPRIAVFFDEVLMDLFGGINEETNLNLMLIVNMVPNVTLIWRLIYSKTPLPVKAIQERIREFALQAEGDGNLLLSTALRATALVLDTVDQIYLHAVATEDPNIYEYYITLTYANGWVDSVPSGICHNVETQQYYGKDGRGMLALGMDWDAGDMALFTVINCFERSLGYNIIYDKIADYSSWFDLDTVRICFPYGNEDYMIQIWKGRYLISNGGEIGLYKKPKSRRINHYDCLGDDEMAPISMKVLLKDGKVVIDQAERLHWWTGGFALNSRYYYPQELTMLGMLTLPPDLLAAALPALEEIMAQGLFTYEIADNTLSFIW